MRADVRVGVLVLAMGWMAPVPALADTITMRFSGQVDLSPFGASPTSLFAGKLQWDETVVPDVDGGYYTQYFIDGAPESVRATFLVNGLDLSDRIEPYSRLELVSVQDIVDDSLSLWLFLQPRADLDNGDLPDLQFVSLLLWTRRHPAFRGEARLSESLAFLGRMDHRSLGFSSAMGEDPVVSALAEHLEVPEPPLLVLLAAGVAALRRRRSPRNRVVENHLDGIPGPWHDGRP